VPITSKQPRKRRQHADLMAQQAIGDISARLRREMPGKVGEQKAFSYRVEITIRDGMLQHVDIVPWDDSRECCLSPAEDIRSLIQQFEHCNSVRAETARPRAPRVHQGRTRN